MRFEDSTLGSCRGRTRTHLELPVTLFALPSTHHPCQSKSCRDDGWTGGSSHRSQSHTNKLQRIRGPTPAASESRDVMHRFANSCDLPYWVEEIVLDISRQMIKDPTLGWISVRGWSYMYWL